MSDRVRALALASGVLTIGLLLAASAGLAQERAWIGGEVRLNLRTGPGTEYRILGFAQTGDAASVLERTDEWTKVRLENGKEGWIPLGYLKTEPPAQQRLSEVESLAESLQARLATSQEEATGLRQKNEALAVEDVEQQAKLRTLSMENMELKAGARWPEWITGAAILAVGMLLGAIWHRSSTRRQSSRIRL